jgi:hypothetical protein
MRSRAFFTADNVDDPDDAAALDVVWDHNTVLAMNFDIGAWRSPSS